VEEVVVETVGCSRAKESDIALKNRQMTKSTSEGGREAQKSKSSGIMVVGLDV
jgi:hypothetical protein